MNVFDIRESRRRREHICEIADWVVANIPWTIEANDWPDFGIRWPNVSTAEFDSVDAELERRAAVLCAEGADLDTIASKLFGRPDKWLRATDWLFAKHASAGVHDPEFRRLFGELTRAELVLAAIENKRRLLDSIKR